MLLRNGEVTAWMLALAICIVQEDDFFPPVSSSRSSSTPSSQLLGTSQIVLGETFGNQASTNWSTTHGLNILL